MMSTQRYMIIGSLLAGVVLGLAVVFVIFQKPVTPRPEIVSAPATPLPSEAPVEAPSPEPQNTDTSWLSPEGKVTLIMKSVVTPESQRTYSFFVQDNTVENPGQTLVFTKTVPGTSTMTIPFNSWAPGNQYFFVQEHDGDAITYFVLKTKGTVFSNQDAALNVNELFAAKNSTYTFGEATGWAAPTLLIVNTKTTEMEQGPTFWFDVNRLTLQRLSTSFQ